MSAITELLDVPHLHGAACVGRGELFFAAPSELGMAAEARAICASCPALADCREWITLRERDHPREHGIWAGLSMSQREGSANRHTTPCAECGRPMRSHSWDPVEWPGTVVAQGHGLCSACYLRHRKRDRHRSRKARAQTPLRKCAGCGRSIRPCGALAASFPGTIAQHATLRGARGGSSSKSPRRAPTGAPREARDEPVSPRTPRPNARPRRRTRPHRRRMEMGRSGPHSTRSSSRAAPNR